MSTTADDTLTETLTLMSILTDANISGTRRFVITAANLRSFDAAHKRENTDLRLALQTIRNHGETHKMVNGTYVAEIAAKALKGER